jgi:hypothetical protein
MGLLSTWPIYQIQSSYKLNNFVETGTWKGDGLLHAMRFPFKRLWSVELQPDLCRKARDRMVLERPCDERWSILRGDSRTYIEVIVGCLKGPTLWWLDAHLPERYGDPGDAPKLPLEDEILSIVNSNYDHSGDVFIIDDWRLYSTEEFANGPFKYTQPDGRVTLGPIGTPDAFIDALGKTHLCEIQQRHEGYLVARPK